MIIVIKKFGKVDFDIILKNNITSN